MIYIHIPFCRKKCDYCDFLSFDNQDALQEAYKNALVSEMARFRRGEPCSPTCVPRKISSVYIGGGTPTVLPSSFLREILAEVRKFDLAANAEITCEANPESITEAVLETLQQGGVNRLSIGLQSTLPHLLQNIGRESFSQTIAPAGRKYVSVRTPDNRLQSIQLTKKYFGNISIDLMFALPGQTLPDWRQTLQTVLELSPTHISAYALTPEDSTTLGKRLRNDPNFALPCPEDDRKMYHMACEFLARHGYMHYEISNFALPGRESRHNIGYWARREYVGFGLGAHSFYKRLRRFSPTSIYESRCIRPQRRLDVLRSEVRRSNTCDLREYISGARLPAGEYITPAEALYETFILGLRMTKGVNLRACEERFGRLPQAYYDWINKMRQEKLLAHSGDFLHLTTRGLDIANYVMAGF